jgi:hypothetical protein
MVIGLIVPIGGAFIDGDGPIGTQDVSGNQIYRWAFWALGWGLTIWQGSWMLRHVGERIIDDMLVTAGITALGLLAVKVIVWIAYQPRASGGDLLPITGIDAAGALALIIIALVAARVNRFE